MSKTPVSRRRLPAAGAEGGSRAPGAGRESDCLGRTGGFDCSAMDWFLERARALGVEHAPPAPIVMVATCSRSASRPARAWARSCAPSTSSSSMAGSPASNDGLAARQDRDRRHRSRSDCRDDSCCWLCLRFRCSCSRHRRRPRIQLPQPIHGTSRSARFVGGCPRSLLPQFKAIAAIAEALGVTRRDDLPTCGLGLVGRRPRLPGTQAAWSRWASAASSCSAPAAASTRRPPADEDGADGPTVMTSLTAFSPQVSLNFGKRDGWSYLSGGIGLGIVHDRARGRSRSRMRRVAPAGVQLRRRRALVHQAAPRLHARSALLRDQRAGSDTGRPAFPSMTIMVFSAGMALK